MKYWLDDDDRIVEVDENWLPSAIDNGAPELNPAHVCGRPLDSFISDTTTRLLWRSLVRRARLGEAAMVIIRSDAPDRRRLVLLRLSRDGGRVLVRSDTITDELRAPVALLESGRSRAGDAVQICSWCAKVLLPSKRWVEIEVAVEELGLRNRLQSPPVKHCVCESCVVKNAPAMQAASIQSPGIRTRAFARV